MKCKKNVLATILVILFCVITGCNLVAEDVPPYFIEGYLECNKESSVYNNAGLTFKFYNVSDKNIKSFTIVCFIYDENGEPIGDDSNCISFTIDFPMKKRQYVPLTVALDELLTEPLNENCFIENLYVSKIIYDDDSDWGDPLGIYCPEIMFGGGE